jgi:hypothetical protein
MDMAEHTPGPWHVTSNAICEGRLGYGEIVAEARPDIRVGGWYANARRIVAAVNACEGIPTEALEAVVGGSGEEPAARLEALEILAGAASRELRAERSREVREGGRP